MKTLVDEQTFAQIGLASDASFKAFLLKRDALAALGIYRLSDTRLRLPMRNLAKALKVFAAAGIRIHVTLI